jgi:hypothetical protein
MAARTSAGRCLIVVTRPAGKFDFWIVGAREMNSDETVEYTSWEAER